MFYFSLSLVLVIMKKIKKELIKLYGECDNPSENLSKRKNIRM